MNILLVAEDIEINNNDQNHNSKHLSSNFYKPDIVLRCAHIVSTRETNT